MSGHLLHNLLLFGRLLRGLGLDVNSGRMMDLVRALEYVQIGNKHDFYYAARSLLVHRREDLPLFDQAFEQFWRRPGGGWTPLERQTRRNDAGRPQGSRARPPRSANFVGMETPEVFRPADSSPVVLATLTYSAREVLRQKDFAGLTGEETAAVKALMAGLVWQPGERRTRRWRVGSGRSLDLRRTLRHNLRYGGEVLEWARREPKRKPRPLVILADISGSMERYTRLLLQFIYSLARGLDRPVEAFVFSTRLTRITRQLRGRDVDHALRDVARTVPDWSGGTRIGQALRTFNFDWGRRVLGRGAVVVLISDGWDRGDADLLGREMARLQRSCHRLVWLNPLLGTPGYQPLTRGMQAALPCVDDFLPAHNLASLQDLAAHLGQVGRPRRFPKPPGV